MLLSIYDKFEDDIIFDANTKLKSISVSKYSFFTSSTYGLDPKIISEEDSSVYFYLLSK